MDVFTNRSESPRENMVSKIGDIETGKKEKGEEDSHSIGSSFSYIRRKANSIIIILILSLGTISTSAFLAIGIKSARQEQHEQFSHRVETLTNQIYRTMYDYMEAGAWVHDVCRGRDFTRSDFRQTYEYLQKADLDVFASQYVPYVEHKDRAAMEEASRLDLLERYNYTDYIGFVEFTSQSSLVLKPRDEAEFYYPVHYSEPIDQYLPYTDFDHYTPTGKLRKTVDYVREENVPGFSDRIILAVGIELKYGFTLMHPGFNITGRDDEWPLDLAVILVLFDALLQRAVRDLALATNLYLFDLSPQYEDDGDIVFLGGVRIPADSSVGLSYHDEISLDAIRKQDHHRYSETVMQLGNKQWVAVASALPGSYTPDLTFVIAGAAVIFFASISLALWVYTNARKLEKYNRLRSQNEAERAALILDNARKATKAERELNDFIAHEVRNPVAAAMSACAFVKTAVQEKSPLRTKEAQEQVQDDVNIIDNSLRFVNDLLRNMLDMHRSANKQLKLKLTPTDLLHDVFEPVQSLLAQRESKFDVIVDCPKGLVIMSDRLRLKQICLNLGRNSVKFVDKGFIRLKAEVIDHSVHIFTEDSGPGIPAEKRGKLFTKFQESLDSLSQGTGIGLFLCQNLVELMEGEIYLDDSYNSGVEGYPGARFVINLKQEPMNPHLLPEFEQNGHSVGEATDATALNSDESAEAPKPLELPEALSVLFVDDDPILRKLFSRTVRTVAPSWKIREASNGETALRLVDEESFDLMFVDMYMASVEKQLLGTETVREMRAKGIDCRICGLSANDKEVEFLDAGANVFTFKPFPCEKIALTKELTRVLFEDGKIPSDQL